MCQMMEGKNYFGFFKEKNFLAICSEHHFDARQRTLVPFSFFTLRHVHHSLDVWLSEMMKDESFHENVLQKLN